MPCHLTQDKSSPLLQLIPRRITLWNTFSSTCFLDRYNFDFFRYKSKRYFFYITRLLISHSSVYAITTFGNRQTRETLETCIAWRVSKIFRTSSGYRITFGLFFYLPFMGSKLCQPLYKKSAKLTKPIPVIREIFFLNDIHLHRNYRASEHM